MCSFFNIHWRFGGSISFTHPSPRWYTCFHVSWCSKIGFYSFVFKLQLFTTFAVLLFMFLHLISNLALVIIHFAIVRWWYLSFTILPFSSPPCLTVFFVPYSTKNTPTSPFFHSLYPGQSTPPGTQQAARWAPLCLDQGSTWKGGMCVNGHFHTIKM